MVDEFWPGEIREFYVAVLHAAVGEKGVAERAEPADDVVRFYRREKTVLEVAAIEFLVRHVQSGKVNSARVQSDDFVVVVDVVVNFESDVISVRMVLRAEISCLADISLSVEYRKGCVVAVWAFAFVN